MIETINTLGVFRAVAEVQSFRAAASNLAVSPATVSRRIAELEADLGVQLFVRTTRNVYLTDVGVQLLEDTQAPMRDLAQALKMAADSTDEMEGLVKIAVTHSNAETMILPLLPKMYAEFPDIRLELLLDEEIVDIRTSGIDFALRFGKLSDPTLISRKICTESFSYYKSADAPDNAPLLNYSRAEDAPVKPYLQVKDMRMQLRLLNQGFGTAVLPDALVAEWGNTDLVRDTSRPSNYFDGYIVYHANRFVPRRTRYVMDMIIAREKRR